jgi:hypothetical protein
MCYIRHRIKSRRPPAIDLCCSPCVSVENHLQLPNDVREEMFECNEQQKETTCFLSIGDATFGIRLELHLTPQISDFYHERV